MKRFLAVCFVTVLMSGIASAGIVSQFGGGTATFEANEFGASGVSTDYSANREAIPPADEYWFDYWVKPLPGWIEG